MRCVGVGATFPITSTFGSNAAASAAKVSDCTCRSSSPRAKGERMVSRPQSRAGRNELADAFMMSRVLGQLLRGRISDEGSVSQRFEKGHERRLVLWAQAEAGHGMLGEVWIQRGRAEQGTVVVVDHFFQRGEATIVHVGRSQRHIAE